MDKTLLEYLSTIVSLEKDVYAQNQAIEQTEQKIEELGIPVNYRKPDAPSEVSSFDGDAAKGGLSIGCLIGGIIGLFSGEFMLGIILGTVAGGGLTLLFTSMHDAGENQRISDSHKANLSAYYKAVAEDEIRVEKENEEQDRLREILSDLEDRRNSTMLLLAQYYDVGIVFPKYRNLIAMCSIYEYFMSGSCDTWKEAYNKYDNEVLARQIITKLDEVVVSLDSIRQNQFMLYDVIQDGNRISRQLVSASIEQSKLLEKSIDYQALQATYSEQLSNQVHFQNQLMIYDMWHKEKQS